MRTRRTLEKLAANQAVEAVRDALSHLQRWVMSLEMDNVERPPFLDSDCRRARRLREVLEVQAGSNARQPEVQLDDVDGDLLARCCLYAVESLETSGALMGDDVEFVQRQMENLYTVARAFASSRLELIRGPGLGVEPTPEVTKMLSAINTQIASRPAPVPGMPSEHPQGNDYSGGARPGPGHPPGYPAPAPGWEGHPGNDPRYAPDPRQADPRYADSRYGEPPYHPDSGFPPEPGFHPDPGYGAPAAYQGYGQPGGLPPHAPIGHQGYGETGYEQPVPGRRDPPPGRTPAPSFYGNEPSYTPVRPPEGTVGQSELADWTGEWGGHRNPLPGEEAPPPAPEFGVPAQPAPPQREPPRAPRPVRSTAWEGDRAATSASLLSIELQRLKDPRLRSMMMLDLKALSRAAEIKDHRLVSVLLSSLFEAMVTDIALQRRAELSLRGTPETWQLARLVPAILGDHFAPTDRNTLFHLVNCKNLVRPAVQLLNPLVVTQQTVDKMIEFVQKFIVDTGLVDRP